ncbi:DUF7373 family lipoprotein [Nocardia thailandica]|uniref:DUF7373 family lipoprotein n=1 Tax=Nocardia thailandica TaxID=257275 RepID=UPI00030041C6|nr:hypothetical protein [Nocardia thailandica]
MRKTASALAALVLTALLSACGSTVAGTPQPGEIDIRKLDAGGYPTEPFSAHDDPYRPGFTMMDDVAAMTLAEFVVTAYDIDPAMKYGKRATGVSSGLPPYSLGEDKRITPILKSRRLLYGFSSKGSSTNDGVYDLGQWPMKSKQNSTTATITVLQFPDADLAATAARELQEADFATYPDKVETVALAKYPNARSYWQPTSPFLRTIMPHGPFVIAFQLSLPTPDKAGLSRLAETAYDKQLDLIGKAKAYTDEESMTLPWDPEKLIDRTLNPDKIPTPDASGMHTLVGPHGLLHYAGDRYPGTIDIAAQQFARMKAQRIAMSYGNIVVRTADEHAADQAVKDRLVTSDILKPAAAPPNLPDSTCFENIDASSTKRFTCMLAYREYVGIVSSDQLLDAQQRATAQYAILANSR